MNRRQFLASIGVATTGSALSGCSSLPGDGSSDPQTDQNSPPEDDTDRSGSGPPTSSLTATGTRTSSRTATPATDRTHYSVEFDRAIDVVENLDADPTGTEPIDPIIEEFYESGTVLEFPPGSYLVERSHHFNNDENVERWGMVGTGDSRSDVEFVFPEGNETAQNSGNHYVLNIQTGRDHVIADMTMQQTRDRTTGVGMILVLSDGLHIENLEFAGFNPLAEHSPGSCILTAITGLRGVGTIRNFVCTGGGVQGTYPHRKVGLLCGSFHVGELRLTGHNIQNMGSNAHYASNHRGCVRIEDCLYRNNDNSNIRVSGGQAGGHPTKDSWAKNCTVVVDIDNADHLPEGESYEFIRGVKCDFGEDVLVEDTDVIYKSAPAAPYCVGVQHNHGKATFRNLRVRSDVDGIGPLFEGQPGDDPVVLENASFTGTASNFHRGRAAVSVRERNETVIRDSCLALTGENQNGIWLQNSEGCQIENVSIDVPGKQIVTENSEPAVTNISNSGTCQAASEN